MNHRGGNGCRKWPSPMWARVIWSSAAWEGQEGEWMFFFTSGAEASILALPWQQRLCFSDIWDSRTSNCPATATNSICLWSPDTAGVPRWSRRVAMVPPPDPSPVADHDSTLRYKDLIVIRLLGSQNLLFRVDTRECVLCFAWKAQWHGPQLSGMKRKSQEKKLLNNICVTWNTEAKQQAGVYCLASFLFL